MASPVAQREKDLVLRVIYNELGRVALKWFKIGIQLGIPHYKLKEFEEERDPLSAVIEYWLSGNVPESDVPISWKSIVAALKVDSVGEPGLAERIHKKHCQPEATVKISAEIQQKPTEDKQVTDISIPDVKPELEQAHQEKDTRIEKLAAKQLPADVRMDLEVALEENLDEIGTQHADYVKCLRDMLKEKAVSAEDLRSYLLSLPAFSKDFKGQNSVLLADQKAELAQKNTINEIFDFLTMKCASFLNYDIFEKIRKAYNINTEREELKYCDRLKAYIHKHKISEFKKINPSLKLNDNSKELILKFDIKNTCTLARIDELKKTLAKILKMESSALHIIDIEDGCVVVTFHTPPSVADILFTPDTVFTPQEENEFRAASVLWLKCNGHTFNFQNTVTWKEATQGLGKLKEQLTCSICLCTYADPKLLHCNHSYCQRCLIQLELQDKQGQLTCPVCRQITPVPANGIASLRSDFRTNQLLEIVESHDLNVDSHDLDADRSSFKKASMTIPKDEAPGHKAVVIEQDETVVSCCPEHGNKVSLYCHTCSESICLKCALKDGKHQGHVCEELDVVLKQRRENVLQSLTAIEKALIQLDTCCSELSEQRVVIEADIHSTILPDDRKTELIDQLHQLTQTKLKSLDIQRDQIKAFQVLLQHSKENRANPTKSILEAKKLTSALQIDMLKPISEATMKLSDIADITTECQSHGLVSANPPDPSKSYATGEGISTSSIGEESSVILHTLDYLSQPCQRVHTNSIKCQLISEKASEALRCSIRKRDESCYDIRYQPTIKGRHQLQIQIKDQHIKGSPFSIIVKIPSIKTIHGLKGHGGIAVNLLKEVVVADGFGQQIVVFGPGEEKLRSFSMVTSNEKIANQVAVDSDQNIYVTDSSDHCIRKFNALGEPLVEVDFNNGEINDPGDINPTGIAIYKDRIYVVTGHSVQIFDSDLRVQDRFGKNGSGEGQFSYPQNIACDQTGNLYVADRGNDRIQVFTPEGKFLRMFGGKGGNLELPHGIAVGNGKVYVSDWGNHRISVFTLNGELVRSFGGRGNKPGQFQNPRGLAVDSDEGVLYVCDTDNHRIQIFKVA